MEKEKIIKILSHFVEEINKDAEFMQSVINKLEKKDKYVIGKIEGYLEISKFLEEIIEDIREEKNERM